MRFAGEVCRCGAARLLLRGVAATAAGYILLWSSPNNEPPSWASHATKPRTSARQSWFPPPMVLALK